MYMPLDQIGEEPLRLGEAEPEVEAEMTFLEHLEELRWHIIRSIGAISVVGIVVFIFNKWFFRVVLFGPTDPDFVTYRVLCRITEAFKLGEALCFSPPEFKVQAIGFAEAFITSIKVSFIAGFLLAFPYVLYEFWRFVRPGLYKEEQNVTKGVVFICSALFLFGVCFGYYVMSPFAIQFLAGYVIPGVENIPTLDSYISYMVMFTAPAGLIFETPVIVYFLSKMGLVTPAGMRQYRRHAIIGILVVAAILTPPDVVTQFLIGIPLFILYEISIFISARVEKQNQKEMA